VNDPSKTAYGTRSASAPEELGVFAFIVGKWDGTGKTRKRDGTFAEYPVTWIGRYILDGTAIADEMHVPTPDGSPYLGITLRQYDTNRRTWIIEHVNVTDSFLRRQVNSDSGSVNVSGRTVTVASESREVMVREHYHVPDDDHFVYRLDVSTDVGRSWKKSEIEMTFRRSAPPAP
jgi:hypothetical protein